MVSMFQVTEYLNGKMAVVVLPPVVEHPVRAVTAQPVAVLAVG